MRLTLLSASLVVLLGLSVPAQAATILFSNRASWLGATSGVTTIDFEGVPPGGATNVAPTYTTAGVTFTVPAGHGLFLADPLCCIPYAATDVLSDQPVDFANLLFQFPTLITALALDFNVDFFRDVRYTLITTSGTETGLIAPAIRPNLAFFGLTSTIGITGLRLETIGASGVGFLNVDNVAFGTARPTVPEPTTLVLLGLGLAAGIRRRFRS